MIIVPSGYIAVPSCRAPGGEPLCTGCDYSDHCAKPGHNCLTDEESVIFKKDPTLLTQQKIDFNYVMSAIDKYLDSKYLEKDGMWMERVDKMIENIEYEELQGDLR